MKTVARLCLILLLPFAAAAQETAPEAAPPDPLSDVAAALRAGDPERARVRAEEALASETLERNDRGRAHLAIALAHIAAGEHAPARAALDTALTLLDRPVAAHYERFKLAYTMEDWTTAAADLVAVARLRPDLALPVHLSAVETMQRGAEAAGAQEIVFEMLLALSRIGYDGGPGGGDRPDRLYRDLALELAERGRLFEAEGVLERVRFAEIIAPMMVDRHYAPLWRILDTRFGTSASAMTARELAYVAELRGRFPGSLDLVRDHMQALRRHGRPGPAADLGEQVMRSLRLDALDPASGAQALWIVNELAYALLDLERPDEAVALMEQIAGLDMRRWPSVVNQWINRGAVLLKAGRYDEAIEAVAQATGLGVSSYGRMFIEQINTCSHLAAGRPSEAELAFAFLADRPMVNPRATQIALLCLDRHEEAVAHMIARLEDPRTRADALIALIPQDLSHEKSDLFRILYARLDTVRADPRVRAAQTDAGRAVTITLRPIYWGAF